MTHGAGPVLDRIRGRLVERAPTRVVVEAGGLGWAVDIPLSTFERLPAHGEVELLCHLAMGAQGQTPRLFGFATPAERDFFRMLLSVNGVGPSTALSALSGSTVAAMAAAIRAEDVKGLQRLKRVGAKTARRIIVELKERVDELGMAAGAAAPLDAAAADAISALVSLGYTRAEADAAVAKARQALPDAPVEILLREGLKRI